MRRLMILSCGLALLAGCAARPAPTPDIPNCAIPTENGETDGGYGGTGNAPEDCPPAQ